MLLLIKTRDDQQLAGCGLQKVALPSAALLPFVAEDLTVPEWSGLQKRAIKSLHSHFKAALSWLAVIVHVRRNIVCCSDSLTERSSNKNNLCRRI